MRYLAVDLGDKRTGLAAGDDGSRIASPLEVVRTADRPTLLKRIQKVIEEQGIEALVVGLPLNMNGTQGPAAKKNKLFAAELRKLTGLPVHLCDERLTSQDADALMARTGLTYGQKKDRRDALAAAVLLRGFWERNG